MHSTNPFDLANSAEEESVPTIVQNGLKALDAGAMKNIKRTKDGWKVGPFLLRDTGAEVIGEVTFDQWKALGEYLASLGSRFQIWLGDWAWYANHQWKMSYDDISEAIDRAYTAGSLRNLASTMSRIDLSLRNDKFTFNHYNVLAKIESAKDLKRWSQWAAEQPNISYRKLEELIFGKEVRVESEAKRELNEAYKQIKQYAEDLQVDPRAIVAIAANIAATGTPDGETPLLAALTEEQYERLQRQRQYIAEGSKYEPVKRYEIPARDLGDWIQGEDVDPDEVLIVTISRTKRE